MFGFFKHLFKPSSDPGSSNPKDLAKSTTVATIVGILTFVGAHLAYVMDPAKAAILSAAIGLIVDFMNKFSSGPSPTPTPAKLASSQFVVEQP